MCKYCTTVVNFCAVYRPVCVAKSTLRVIASNGNVTKSDNLFQVAGKIFLQINQKQKTALLWRFFVVLCFIVLLFYCFVILLFFLLWRFFCFFVIYCFVVIVLYLLLCFLLFCNLMFRILLFCNLLFCFFVVAVIYCFVLFQWKIPLFKATGNKVSSKSNLFLHALS